MENLHCGKIQNKLHRTGRGASSALPKLIGTVSYAVIFSLLIIVTGCSSHIKTVKKEQIVPSVTSEKAPDPGSIWPGERATNMFFADRKARYLNDIITIIIDELSSGENKADTETSRDTTTTAGITGLFGLEKKALEQNRRMGTSFGVGGTSVNSLKGEGKTKRDGKLTGKMTARVIDVIENGNLVIEGKQQLTVNAEDQYMIISGIVRPEDITSDNTVSSQYIADAKIIYTGDGVVNDKMRPGWFTRFIDWAWPF